MHAEIEVFIGLHKQKTRRELEIQNGKSTKRRYISVTYGKIKLLTRHSYQYYISAMVSALLLCMTYKNENPTQSNIAFSKLLWHHR